MDWNAYAPLLKVERSGFAWEWLRRVAEYASAARDALDECAVTNRIEDRRALAWNLHAFENPDLSAPSARPMWVAEAHPWVVSATAERSSSDEDSLDLERLRSLATLVASNRAQRLLLSDGYRSIRLDLRGSDVAGHPARLTFELSGIEALERPLIVLRRLRALSIMRRFQTSLHPLSSRAHRMVQLLRTHDGLRAGANQADIAQVLLRPGLERSRWRIHSPSIRSQAQRLVASARRMSAGGFWDLLE